VNITLIKHIVLLIFIFLMQCRSIDKSAYKNNNIFKGDSIREIESKEKIDNWKTYEIFFTLNGNEDCIKLNLSSDIYDAVINKNTTIKTYFIVEKAIDISKFSLDKKSMFSEIGRNYDYNWNTKQEFDVCSSKSDPIKTLNKNNNFRIRFTVFKDINFKYAINIFSNQSVIITDKNPVIK
jgi:hypothetical protein